MAIKSIKLENFTVFENIEVDFSPGINVFIGENGTGKTHLLKILYAITDTVRYQNSFVGPSEFKGEPVMISNNFDHVIYPLFNAPVEGLAVNLIRNKSIDIESAKIEVTTDTEIITSYVGGLEFVTAVNESDKKGRIFEHEALFIPAKDMLSHSGLENDFAKRLLPFDVTQINILKDLKISRLREQTKLSSALKMKISAKIGGEVLYRDGGYFIDRGNALVNISLEAEGYKKLAVMYRALDTGYLQPGSILLWDEPEANLNPKLIPIVVDILMELSRNKVQVFLATHEYNLMKYFSVKKKDNDHVAFISLHKTENGVICETEDDYNLLEHNSIVEANIKLLEDDIEGVF
ncbi:MAG: AAA family ATPase [Defluviitaleaceae bacterium]|nr:AAA family ATPase [Defluviitaleaceae bacterium]